MNSGPGPGPPAERLCSLCGSKESLVAAALGVCVSCIRGNVKGSLERALYSHAEARKIYGLPECPPASEGIHCKICSHHCRMGEGELGYCGLRWNENGKILALATPQQGLFHAYPDSSATHCPLPFIRTGLIGGESPVPPRIHEPESGSVPLAIFLYGCNFDCLFCPIPTHTRFHAKMVRPAEDLVEMTLRNKAISSWCFFGGSPEPQLPFAINASQKILTALGGKRPLRICFEWNGCGYPELVKKAARIAFESGGRVTFDLKAWNESLHVALTGSSNTVVYENLAMVAGAFGHSSDDQQAWLCATTLLVPGYVDEIEVGNIAKFLANLDPSIPYGLRVFHPDFMMRDLPITPVDQVRACYQLAKQYLQHVHVDNVHLLGLPTEAALG